MAELLVVDAVVNVNVAKSTFDAPFVARVSGVALVSPYAFRVKVLPKHALDTFENATVVKLNPPPFAALTKVAAGVDVIESSQAVVSATP